MPRLAFACHIFATCLLAGHALRARNATKALVQETTAMRGKREAMSVLSAEDVPPMADLEAAYGGAESFWDTMPEHCGRCVSTEDQQEIMRADKEKEWSAGIYGEIRPDSMVRLLRKLGARPGQRFYDLGSGAGKTVAIAAELFGMRATGIELSQDRHADGCHALQSMAKSRVRAAPALFAAPAMLRRASRDRYASLVRGSFFDYDISDADIIFTDSVEFSDDMMARIAALCLSLKEGARIVSAKALPGRAFLKIDELSLPASWGSTDAMVFEKVGLTKRAPLLPTTDDAAKTDHRHNVCSTSWAPRARALRSRK